MFGESKFSELQPPQSAVEQGGSEILRAVIVNNGLHVSLRRGFDDPATWGLVLADIARHASRTFAAETDVSESEALSRIAALFSAELSQPTDLGTTAPSSRS